MTDFNLRIATPDDAIRLSHIGVATFVDSYTFDIAGEAMMAHCTHQHSEEAYAAYLADPNVCVWIAEHTKTGAPIGYALNCSPDLPIAPREGDVELKRIYVLSRFHGSGAGAALMQASIDHARKNRAERLLLGTYEENHRAMDFYSRWGFETIGTRKFAVGDVLYDDVVMSLSVSA